MVSVVTEDQEPGHHYLVVTPRAPGGQLQEVRETHRAALPLHFVLLLPNGAHGWHSKLQLKGKKKGHPAEAEAEEEPLEEEPAEACGEQDGGKLTPLQFYAYHLHFRDGGPHNLFRYIFAISMKTRWNKSTIEIMRSNQYIREKAT